MKDSKNSILILAMLALAWLAPADRAQGQTTQTVSANNSPASATNAVPSSQAGKAGEPTLNGLIRACSAAAADLAATRVLADSLGIENAALRTRLASEKQAAEMLTELAETRKSETAALRDTLAAKNETIAAKDAALAADVRLIDSLRRRARSPWRRIGDILLGAAAGVILK